MVGRRFGRLVGVERAGSNSSRQALWRFQCDCGNEHVSIGALARRGLVQSCGCFRREATAEVGSKNVTHGDSYSRLYGIWAGMKHRCSCPTAQKWADYGGRGITVCAEWDASFETFRDWALANGYSDELSIDRIDNDRGYEPGNCRWATAVDQRHNRRDTVAAELSL